MKLVQVLLCSFLLVFFFIKESQAIIIKIDLPQLTKESNAIVKGFVNRTETKWINDKRGNHIYTIGYLTIEETYKGMVNNNIILEAMGGTIGDITEVVEDGFSFYEGEKVILFLEQNPLNVYAGCQGKISLLNDKVYYENKLILAENLIEAIKTLIKNPNANYKHLLSDNFLPEPTLQESSAQSLKKEDSNIPKLTWSNIWIDDVWWTDYGDKDNDEYKRYWKLNIKIKIADEFNHSLTLKIYKHAKGSSNYELLFTFPTWEWKNNNITYIWIGFNTNELDSNKYNFKIEVYETGRSECVAIRDTVDDNDLKDKQFETTSMDQPPNCPTITSISPSKASAGTYHLITIRGNNLKTYFPTYVFFFYKSGKNWLQGSISTLNNDEIIVSVPIGTVDGYPASASSGGVVVKNDNGESEIYPFNISFGYNRTNWAGTNPEVSYKINENYADIIGEGKEIRAAATEWTNVGTNFSFYYAGSHTNTTSSKNGDNEIMWANLGAGALAITNWWFTGSTCIECDITFNADYKWNKYPGENHYDIQSTAIHEFGHWLNLRDIYGDVGDGEHDVQKVMYGFGWKGMLKRHLHLDDIYGIRYIYTGGSDATLSITDNIIPSVVSPVGGSYSFKINLSGTNATWKIENIYNSWVGVSSTSGGSGNNQNITVNVMGNTGRSRKCTLTVYSPQAGYKYIIFDQAGKCALSISDNKIPNPVHSTGGSYNFNISLTGVGCSWYIMNPCKSWVILSDTSGVYGLNKQVNVNVNSNYNGTSRSCTLLVYVPSIDTLSLVINQITTAPIDTITFELWIDNLTSFAKIDETKKIIEGEEYIFPNVKLPTPFTKYQSLYNALVGTHFYIEEGAIDRNLTINFAITIPGGDTLYKKIGGKQVWFYGVIDVAGFPIGYTFLNNKAAVMKVPRHAGFNYLTKTLGWTIGTNYKFGYFNTQTNIWSGIGIASFNRDYPDPRIDTVEARITHFSDIGAGDEELTKIDISEIDIPSVFALQQNFPNPFNPTTNIKFNLPQKCVVSICVYNLLGEKISDLLNEEKEAGYHQIKFNADGLPSGIYFYQMRASDFIQTKKIVVLK